MALAALMGHVHEALARNADADLVEDGIGRLLHDGTGADRQRRVFERTQDLQYLIAAALD